VTAFVGLAATALAVLLVVPALGTDTRGARVLRFTINSPLVHGTVPVSAVVPAGVSAGLRPLLVFLHGKGENQDSNLDNAMFAALARLGSRAPDVVFPYGGADSYWHDRADGAWGSFVVNEVIAQALSRLHADPKRVAIGGISMGGFGALDIARLRPGRFCAVGAHSAALWVSGGQSAAGAFDDARTSPATTSSPPPAPVTPTAGPRSGSTWGQMIRSALLTPHSPRRCGPTVTPSSFTSGPDHTIRTTGRATGPATSTSTPPPSPTATRADQRLTVGHDEQLACGSGTRRALAIE
jgi:S-formylglutathione hydrolase FrmB